MKYFVRVPMICFFLRGRHYGDLEKKSDALCTLSSRSLSHQFISISAIYVFMVAMATRRAAQHQQKAIYLVGAAAKKLPSPLCQRRSLAGCCVLFICALVAAAAAETLSILQARERASFFANNQKEERRKMSLDAPPDDEKCCCYCEKINSPALSRSNTHSPGEPTNALCSFPLNLYVCERGLKLESERARERSCIAPLSLSLLLE